MRRLAALASAAVAIAASAAAAVALNPAADVAANPAAVAPTLDKSVGPGLGTSKVAPEGTAFTLPPGLTLEDPVLAYNVEDPIDCDDKFKKEAKGTGGAVALCLVFFNRTNAPIVLTLPPGLIFVSRDGDVQNGLLAQAATIEVPAGERYFAPLFLYCVNEDRGTSSPKDEYALGPVTQQTELQEIFAFIEARELSRDDIVATQRAVTHVTNGEGLRSADRAALQAK